MTTLANLVNEGKLIRYEAELRRREQPQRYVYLAPALVRWMETDLPSHAADRGRYLLPDEQVERALHAVIRGDRLVLGDHYKKIKPYPRHVWELRPVDVRLFGWFPRRGHLVLVCAALKKHLRRNSDYDPYIRDTITFRDALNLDEPKAVPGERYDEVL